MGRDGSCVVRVDGTTGKIGFKNVRNVSESIPGVYAELTWKLRWYSANNSSIQVKVGGWQSRGTIATGVKLYVNGETRTAMVTGSNISLSASSEEQTIAEIPSAYAPIEGTVTGTAFDYERVMVRTNNRAVNIYNFNKSITGLSFTILYPY